MTNNGFSPDDPQHLAHAELHALMTGLKLPETFNPYEVIRTPSEDRGKDTVHVTLRLSKHIDREVRDMCGSTSRFRDRSEWIRHYIAVGLMVERELAPENSALQVALDPLLLKIRRENTALKQQAWDENYDSLTHTFQYADGPKEKARMIDEGRTLATIAELCEWEQRLEKITNWLKHSAREAS